MMTMIEEMFAEMLSTLGCAWYECDDEWETMEETMVASGLDADEVRAFFAEMEADL